MNMDAFSRFRLPIGSVVVDATMIFFIAWWGSGVTQAIADINDWRSKQEQITVLPGTAVRLAAIETRMDRNDRDRDEILAALKRIEDKLDRKVDR